MAKSIWTVNPDETKRVDAEWAGNPFWVEMKQQLTEGEQRRVQTSGFKSIKSDPQAAKLPEAERSAEITIDWVAQSFARTLAWVTDWSLADVKGNKLPVRRDTLEQLHPDMYAAIEGVINEHVEQREQEKKVKAGSTEPKQISA